RMQAVEDIAASMARDFMSTGDPHFTQRYTERLQEVTAEQVQAMARKYLDRSRLLTTVLLPAETVGADGLPKAEELIRPSAPKAPEDAGVAAAGEVNKLTLDNN